MEKDDIYSKLMSKLIDNLIPNLDNVQSERYLSYFLRLLNSRLSVVTSNETNILNSLLDRVSKHKEGLTKVEKIQNLYYNLSLKKTIKRRWAISFR